MPGSSSGRHKNIDWYGLRGILGITVGLVIFAVIQPLLWQEVFDKRPPQFSSDFAGLIVVLVTILSLALAGFGLVTYQLVERKAEAGLSRRAQELEDNFKAHAAVVTAQLYVSISYQAFLSCEKLWRSKSYSDDHLQDGGIREFLESAIQNAETARDVSAEIPRSILERDGECAYQRSKCIANHAYLLATRKYPADEKYVLGIANELDQDNSAKGEFNIHETIAWSYLRYSDAGQPFWSKGLRCLESVMTSTELSEDEAQIMRERYRGAFAKRSRISKKQLEAVLKSRPALAL